MAVEAAEWDRRIAAALDGCSDDARDFFREMRREIEQLLMAQGSAAGDRTALAQDVVGLIAQRLRAGADRCLAELMPRTGLVERWSYGYTMPMVAAAFRKRRADAEKKRARRAAGGGGTGVGQGGTGVGHLPPPQKTTVNPEENPVPGWDVVEGGTGWDPPLVSSPPITPSSSLPPSHTHRAADAENPVDGDDLDSRLRQFLGGHRMLNWHPKGHAIARQMAESGGWNGMVQALDVAVAEGAAEPFSYARKVLAGMQAKTRLGRIGKPAAAPAERVTKARTFNV